MKGFTKYWNTRQDVYNSLEKFPEKTKEKLQEWLNTKNQWIIVKKLENNENGISDSTHKIVKNKDDNGFVTERYQYELKEDPNGPIFQIGMTIQEVEDILN